MASIFSNLSDDCAVRLILVQWMSVSNYSQTIHVNMVISLADANISKDEMYL